MLVSTVPVKVRVWPASEPSSTWAYESAYMIFWPTLPGPPPGRYQYGLGSLIEFGLSVRFEPEYEATRSAKPQTPPNW